jgi:hypothetical protein
LNDYPLATHGLIQFGTNDAKASVPTDEFRNNIRIIIRAVEEAGMRPLLAKAPIPFDGEMHVPCNASSYAAREMDMWIRRYNTVIDELAAEYNLEVAPDETLIPPDFYSHFEATANIDGKSVEYSDCWHPNNTGYDSMARMWAEVLQVTNDNPQPRTHIFKYKSDPERLSNNDISQPDDHLFIDIGADETWSFEAVLWIKTTNGIGDFKFLWRGPAGSDVRSSVVAYENEMIANQSNLLGMNTYVNIDYFEPAKVQPVYIKGLFSTRSKAGRIRLEWSQREASGTTSVYFPSYIEARRVMERPIHY